MVCYFSCRNITYIWYEKLFKQIDFYVIEMFLNISCLADCFCQISSNRSTFVEAVMCGSFREDKLLFQWFSIQQLCCRTVTLKSRTSVVALTWILFCLSLSQTECHGHRAFRDLCHLHKSKCSSMIRHGCSQLDVGVMSDRRV